MTNPEDCYVLLFVAFSRYLCPCVKADGCGFQTGSLKDLDHHMKMHEKRTSYWYVPSSCK